MAAEETRSGRHAAGRRATPAGESSATREAPHDHLDPDPLQDEWGLRALAGGAVRRREAWALARRAHFSAARRRIRGPPPSGDLKDDCRWSRGHRDLAERGTDLGARALLEDRAAPENRADSGLDRARRPALGAFPALARDPLARRHSLLGAYHWKAARSPCVASRTSSGRSRRGVRRPSGTRC